MKKEEVEYEVHRITTKDQYELLVRALQDKDVLDHRFDSLHALKETIDRSYVLDSIDSFFKDTKRAITELNSHLKGRYVNYEEMADSIHLLRGSSAGVGGFRAVLSCYELMHACIDNDKKRCRRAYGLVKEEHYKLKDSLRVLYQMEKTILAEEEKAAALVRKRIKREH
ncbi:putative Histidine-containing phosphotransfer protein [Quillaja saponaria]|uniref:Histidine-containing phosphotransfer protein n=1 Tax=Quillaja saponaria TaxID=32244 RepID=A0AAD7KY88_QUISA|nr:putative Histidine-containing phosphotransfer protein [Quillaja saponaria]